MATIGLDKLFYSKITEDADGNETYGTPVSLAKAMTAELSVELAEATLYADDGAAEIVKEFQSGTLSLGVDNIGLSVAADLTGATIDNNNVLISASEDGGAPVAIGFRAKKANGKYRYFWLYRVKFGIPSTNLTTKGDSIEFSTPTIEGTVLRRNKVDGLGNHPWKAEVSEDDSGVPATTISNWYNSVYEPVYPNPTLTALSIGSLTLSPTFNAAVTEYTASTSNATNTVSATASSGATATIKANGTTIDSGDSVTWNTGTNTVVIVVVEDSVSKTYTVTVTKGA